MSHGRSGGFDPSMKCYSDLFATITSPVVNVVTSTVNNFFQKFDVILTILNLFIFSLIRIVGDARYFGTKARSLNCVSHVQLSVFYESATAYINFNFQPVVLM